MNLVQKQEWDTPAVQFRLEKPQKIFYDCLVVWGEKSFSVSLNLNTRSFQDTWTAAFPLIKSLEAGEQVPCEATMAGGWKSVGFGLSYLLIQLGKVGKLWRKPFIRSEAEAEAANIRVSWEQLTLTINFQCGWQSSRFCGGLLQAFFFLLNSTVHASGYWHTE